MMAKPQRAGYFGVSFVFTLLGGLSSPNLYADDIDIYLSNNVASTNPNILFIFDNSGSMAGEVETQIPYDPAISYNGSYASGDLYVEVDTDIVASMASGIVRCDEMFSHLDEFGVYSDNLAWWNANDNVWSPFSKTQQQATIQTHIECRADSGVHGQANGDGKPYAVHGATGPWSDSNRFEIRWKGVPPVNIYTGNYLNWRTLGAKTNRTKIDVVRDVAFRMVSTLNNVNVGLMSFNAEEGGKIDVAVEDVNVNRQALRNGINNFSASTWTPLAETLSEAKRYLMGQQVRFGGNGDNNARLPSNNARYKSPITSSCQKTNIVLLTDGEPTKDTNHNGALISEMGLGNCASHDNNCLDEIATYLYSTDLRPDGATGLNGVQNAKVYTIGFDLDLPILKQTAENTDAKYFVARDALELERSLKEIAQEAITTSSTFIAPSVSVNQLDNAIHDNNVYFAMFEPAVRERWSGNIKKYQINPATGLLVDRNGVDAVDTQTALFKDTAESFWGNSPDGANVKIGGAAAKLGNNRRIYTYTGNTAPNNTNLATSANRVSTTNAFLTNALLDASSDAQRENIINWVNGIDVLDQDGDNNLNEANRYLADPLHSQPVVLSYGPAGSEKTTLFYGDNLGILHGIDAETGEELFGFIPQELLPNLEKYYTNDAFIQKLYGMDGHITLWRNDLNGDGNIINANGSVDSNEHVYLYAGMRRGGRNYYALDITDRNSPKLKWRITGGTGDFARLGQSWSSAQLATVPWGCNSNGGNTTCNYRKVLFFSGGYDKIQDVTTVDANGNIPEDSMGNVVYMVDAETGALLWKAGKEPTDNLTIAEMRNSIPSGLTIGDLNNNGVIDTLYFVDVAGRVFRVDINEKSTGASDFATGAMVADFSRVENNNYARFYNQPDVAFFNRPDIGTFLTVALGSGSRANPMNTDIENRFYLFKDPFVFKKPESQADYGFDSTGNEINESDLFDATSNILQSGTDAQKAIAEAELESKNGWYIKLADSGEKVLSSSVTLQGELKFTTYNPTKISNASECLAIGSGRAYVMNITDATASSVKNNAGELVRVFDLQAPGIPPSPAVIFIGQDGKSSTVTLFGATSSGNSNEPTLNKTYWRSND
ncbi:MAG: PilC/PilY family type IV pilus protein [Ketobacteraceae bacterium]|nr:PilC/PilY family type IV pilus protein [Ketobacteraceae bacterium]